MFANPDFAFPGRKNITPSAIPVPQSASNTISHHTRRSSAHSRQFSVSSAILPSSPPSPVRATHPRPASGSHHRRRSSVSSRRESHEMMGISLPLEVPEDKHSGDSRQRALWALEGKKSAGSSAMLGFTKVEIPEWHTPDTEKDDFAWSPSSSGFPSTGSSATPKHGLSPLSLTSSLTSKRDSFGKNLVAASASLKAELHTLLEEDEDDEEESGSNGTVSQAPLASHAIMEEPEPISDEEVDDQDTDDTFQDVIVTTPVVSAPSTHLASDLLATPMASSSRLTVPLTPKVIPASPSHSPRPRPASLTLRPLALVPSLPTSVTATTISSSPRLKSLTLATNLPAAQTTTPRNTNESVRRRHSLLMNGATSPSPSPNSINTSNPAASRAGKQRRGGSIGYRRPGEETSTPVSSSNSLHRQSLPPTPGLTPNSAVTHRSASPSTPSDSMSSSRASSEFFHSQAVASLLSRITSLEEALSTAATSPASDARMSLPPFGKLPLDEEKIVVHHQSTDEFVTVIADLKAERDELNSDITGWRSRCSDLNHSVEILQRRLADERRELILAHQRLSSLTSEVNTARSAKTKAEDDLAVAQSSIEAGKEERRRLEDELNEEQTAKITLEMRANKDRLAWLKEKESWETERRGWFAERTELEYTLSRCEKTIESLKQELQEKNKQMDRLRGTPDVMATPKARVPFTGAVKAFTFPGVPAPAVSSPIIDEFDRPRTSAGFGGLNSGFKFGGATPAPAVDTTPKAVFSLASPTTDKSMEKLMNAASGLGVVTEEDEDEEDPLSGYEQEEEGDASYEEYDEENPFDAIPAPAAARIASFASQVTPEPSPMAPKHQHRRSVSVVANWKFPSPKTMEKRRDVATKEMQVDRFFACLEDEETSDQFKVRGLVGKPMKVKEHKKLPSGCPAFWLDCDEEDQVIQKEVPLPSPSITEEEDEGEEESSTPGRSSTVSPLPVPLVSQPVVTPSTSAASLVAPVPAAKVAKPSVRVSSARPSSSSTVTRRIAAPVFLPSPAASAPLPVVSVPLTTVPPAAKPAMVVPPSVNVAKDAFGSSSVPTPDSTPEKVAPTASAYPMSFTSRLSLMMSWNSRKPECMETLPAEPVGAASVLPSPSSSPAKIMRVKHVDPGVMRERLRAQLEAEGRLTPTKPKRVTLAPQELSPSKACGKCSSSAILEL